MARAPAENIMAENIMAENIMAENIMTDNEIETDDGARPSRREFIVAGAAGAAGLVALTGILRPLAWPQADDLPHRRPGHSSAGLGPCYGEI